MKNHLLCTLQLYTTKDLLALLLYLKHFRTITFVIALILLLQLWLDINQLGGMMA